MLAVLYVVPEGTSTPNGAEGLVGPKPCSPKNNHLAGLGGRGRHARERSILESGTIILGIPAFEWMKGLAGQTPEALTEA